MKSIFSPRILLAIAFGFLVPAEAQVPVSTIDIAGSNGQVAKLLGIKTASAQGITVQLVPEGPLLGVTWDKIDLEKLKVDHPGIFKAYELAVKDGSETELNMGSFYVEPRAQERVGWKDVNVSGIRYVLQMPSSGKAKGIIFIAFEDGGHQFVPVGRPGMGLFGDFQEKHDFAIMSFDANFRSSDLGPGEFADFILPEKQSGEGLLKAIGEISADQDFADLEKAPLVLWGTGRTGAAFAFNFTQWKPERVIAAVASNGAFYAQEPTEESAKVPVLFVWGQNNSEPDRWKATDRREAIFREHSWLNPNWIDSMESLGVDSESDIHSYMVFEFLGEMIKERLPEEPGESLRELTKSGSFVGNRQTFEISLDSDPESPPSENETWLPGRGFGEKWSAFARGDLEVPERE